MASPAKVEDEVAARINSPWNAIRLNHLLMLEFLAVSNSHALLVNAAIIEGSNRRLHKTLCLPE
jgi:hypothetical protein